MSSDPNIANYDQEHHLIPAAIDPVLGAIVEETAAAVLRLTAPDHDVEEDIHDVHDVHIEDPELPPPMEETDIVKDPLAILEGCGVEHHDNSDQEQAALDAGEEAAAAAMEAAAAAEAAEACLGNVLDDVGVDVHTEENVADMGPVDHHVDHHMQAHHHHDADDVDMGAHQDEGDFALAAAAAAAAVQAADGMAVVVDQALLATAAAAAASQVAEVLAESQPNDHTATDDYNVPQDAGAPPLPPYPEMFDPDDHGSPSELLGEHGDLLEQRRQKDRKRYSAMTPEARASYNAHRRALYHKQGENARKRRRERERDRYHSLEGDSKKSRNERRAKLERDRYNRLSKDELANRNSKRRDRAKARKVIAKSVPSPAEESAPIAMTIPPPQVLGEIKMEVLEDDGGVGLPHLPDMGDDNLGAPLAEATVDVTDAHAMADASALAAEVAEQVIAGTNLEDAMEAVSGDAPTHGVMEEEEGPTVQI
mmetsp:Transcript_6846/g.10984  ORF Transcript_6846/g.10984 Transcript_6846/m.10984 type:complete len:480 (+) Transcript_6846:126-1565(+)